MRRMYGQNYDYRPRFRGLAIGPPAGDLCPSADIGIWDRQWPIRPDVVFEGGNFAPHDGANPGVPIDDLQLVTTHYRPQVRLLDTFGDTSAATGSGANLRPVFGRLAQNYGLKPCVA